ncbi:MAG: FAD-dependent oxidoreductase [Rhodospirillales bacterium]|nr:FAD-dependent oxidoreductase [Rhodospirillales bacterium]
MTDMLPAAAKVVVIGGGIMGCSTTYHLAKFGVKDVVLLEREKIGAGTTWHSAANVRQLRSTQNLTTIVRNSIELYTSLEKETGQATGWVQTGSLSIATDKGRLTHIERQTSLARYVGTPVDIVDAKECQRLWPLMRTDDILGAAYSPADGRVNPADTCAALIKGAKARGARVVEGATVIGFEKTRGRISAVVTDKGRIECEMVALTSGLWSRAIAKLAGVTAPLYACEHFYLLTKPIDGLGRHLPTLGDHSAYLYMRDEVGGLLAGCFEPNPKPLPLEKLPKGFAFSLLNEDWEHFEPMMANAIHRMPALETAEAKMLLNGPESFTLDNNFLLGESADVRGFFVGCGMNSVGVASSGGAGRALAEWIIEGRPTLDLWESDIRRFAPLHNNLKALHERIPETLGLHYAIAYPGREPETVRGIRRTPLHDRLAAKGAYFGARASWERPLWFGARKGFKPALTFGRPAWFDKVAAEHKAAREAVVLVDQSTFSKLLVQGSDAESFLQRLSANDVAVAPGRCVYTGLLNDRGGYESDLTIQRLADDSFLLVTGTAQGVRDRDWLERNRRAEDRINVTDVTSGCAVLGVAGPRSRELLGRVSPTDFSSAAFPYYAWQDIEIGYGIARACRLSYTGELGFELYIPSEFAVGVYDALVEAGADLGLRDIGIDALTCLRVEKGYRAWGTDIGPEDNPYEAGLGFSVKLGKNTPFLGQDALRRKKEEGWKRRLLSFTLDSPRAYPIGRETIFQKGRVVGQVTSAAFGHTVGRAIGMGYVRGDEAEVRAMIAKPFEIEIAAKRFKASASLEPPYDPKSERTRG